MAQSTRDRLLRSEQGQTAHARSHWTGWFSALVRQVSQRLANRYEPAKHYMRGPGPKTLEQRRKETS
jgi:hypothetical protein